MSDKKKETTENKVEAITQNSSLRLWTLLAVLIIAIAGAGYFFTKEEGASETTQASMTETEDASEMAELEAQEEVVVATVDGEEITQADVTEFIKNVPQFQQQPIEQVYPLAIEELITGKIIDKRAAKANTEDDPEVARRMELAREGVIRTVYLENTLSEQLTDEKLRKAYDEFVASQADNRQEEVRASHILVESEEAAKDIIAKLKDGADFEKIASEMSTDKPSGANGGDLGYFTKDQMVPSFANAAFSLDEGEVTSEPVKSQFGYHVIKVVDKRMQEPPSFEEVKPFLEVQERRKVLEANLKKWREEADIQISGADEANAQVESAAE